VSAFDYVTVGHVTVDVLEGSGAAGAGRELAGGGEPRADSGEPTGDGERRAGGGAFYSALQAARLGLRALILTQGRAVELEELLAPYAHELELHVLPARETTTLATHGMGGERRQRLRAWAGPMRERLRVDTEILHLAAVARETPVRWDGQAAFVGMTPQGLMRSWDDGGAITLAELDVHTLPRQLDAAVVSERERPYCADVLARARNGGACTLAVTAAGAPTTLHLADGASAQVPALRVAHARDDLGAGDVFAATFFIALHDGCTPLQAARRGNAAAALRVAGVGAQAVADAAAIARRLSR
jgi:sugar/nucleoside kinase (ribokinase family)